ncbi:FlhC family transcriptional regulator [Iodobacter fluviatilis]|nr:FlhC family transcriptional regulator [Iodobacter fluviatilis]
MQKMPKNSWIEVIDEKHRLEYLATSFSALGARSEILEVIFPTMHLKQRIRLAPNYKKMGPRPKTTSGEYFFRSVKHVIEFSFCLSEYRRLESAGFDLSESMHATMRLYLGICNIAGIEPRVCINTLWELITHVNTNHVMEVVCSKKNCGRLYILPSFGFRSTYVCPICNGSMARWMAKSKSLTGIKKTRKVNRPD